MKLKHFTAALLLGTVFWDGTYSLAAQQPLNDQQILIIIVIGGANAPGNGVAMMRLAFPSVESCEAAAKIMEQDTRGGFVTARCLPTH